MANETKTALAGLSIGELHEVRGVFATSDRMQMAIEQLHLAGFDRADLAVPEIAAPPERATPESGAMEADTAEDARQARTMHTSTAAAIAALAGAGVTVATGGAAAPAVAVALAAGAAVGGATFAVSSAANGEEQAELDTRAALGRLVLSARASSPERRDVAVRIMRAAGAQDIEVT